MADEFNKEAVFQLNTIGCGVTGDFIPFLSGLLQKVCIDASVVQDPRTVVGITAGMVYELCKDIKVYRKGKKV